MFDNIPENIFDNSNIFVKKNLSNRCNYPECSKKLRITDLKCKCNYIYCSLHRLPEQHDCNFNYKLNDQKKIISDMKCESIKIVKI